MTSGVPDPPPLLGGGRPVIGGGQVPPPPAGGARYTLRIDGNIRLTVCGQEEVEKSPSQMTTARREEDYGDDCEDESARLNGVKQRLVVEATDVKKNTSSGPNIGDDGRETWSSKVDFLLSVVGFAVDLGNIWRFPYLCFKNGGGVFLIPYTIMVLFAGVPLFYMELSLGQYYRKGAITTWGRICPLFKGIGYCVIMIAFYTDFFYNVIIAWGFHFLYASFTTKLPWASCNNSFNSESCYEPHYTGLDASEKCAPPPNDNITRISAAEEYFYKGFLGLHAAGDPRTGHVARSLSDLGDVNWHIVICLAIVYLICYFSMWKGIGTSGKVVWFTALFPYAVLGVLFVRGITLPGSEMGIAYYLKPNMTKLWEPSVWQDAATQVFFSLGPGFGVLLAYSSYNSFHNNVYYDALLTSSINCATSFLSGFVIFSVLGYMSCKSGKRIEDVAQEGPGLVFVVYPEALATMPWAPGWSVLFFLMLITLGLDSSFGGSEAIITGLSDEYPIIKRNRERFLLCLFGFYMVIGCFICTNGGILIMEWIIVYGTTWGLLIAVFCEVMVIAFLYGVGQFTADVKEMLGFKPGIYWRTAWTVAAPVVLLLMILSSFIHYRPLEYQDYQYPLPANILGVIFALSAASCIPIVGIYKLFRAPGVTLSQKLERAMTPYRARPTQCEYTPIGGRNTSNDIIL